jgi:CheY-like chemotaxis protein/HPt (histidine-containing phosphotransfer) domain-containing protein
VDVAHDGVEGLGKAQRTTYDAILADIQMPNMDGFEFAKSLRRWQQETGAKPVPIVALTAHAVEGFDRLCRESGMTDFVTKPARRPVLLDAVRRQLVAPGDEPDRPAAPEPSIDILIDPDIADLVPSYLSSRSDDAGRMERWLSEGDFDAVRRCAHDVKASGSAYGFPTLTELGGRIGEAARNGDADAVGLGIDLMREYLDRIHWRVRAERE